MTGIKLAALAVALVAAVSCTTNPTSEETTAATASSLMTCLTEDVFCPMDDLPPNEQEELREGGCWITGGGHFGSPDGENGAGRHQQDSLGFNAMGMRDGRIRGEIQVTTHEGDLFHGHADHIRCYHDGGDGPEVPKADVNVAVWGGHGSWNHEEGHTWEAEMVDRAEGGSDRDEFEIRVFSGDGALVYAQTRDTHPRIAGGNLQIHPPNGGHPYEVVAAEQP